MAKSLNAVWQESSWDSTWDTWWHYKEGVIGGPSHWGQTALMAITNDVWSACYQGKMQSPINISTKHLIDVEIVNTGQDLQMKILDSTTIIVFSEGPLVYDYRLFGAIIKFGSKSSRGSDHQIDGISFPAELQLYAFNYILYPNFSVALSKPNGLAVLSIFCQVGNRSSADLEAIFSIADHVQLKGQFKKLHGLLLDAIIPSTVHYMTYQGSLPFPACYETVTWIILNQPVIITETQLKSLRQLRISSFWESGRMADNYRIIQKINRRSVRTNIDFEQTQPYCSMQSRRSYIVSKKTVEN
ncbi:carbonic anhydrase-related [Schistosoma mansoni]|uniref:carbonic anhydrase-related n=1 Tax=Schistosoma mansoni TaxID=6183 RepID=UPI00022DBE86|nr:carbonic anhydrase-related [Schistosoma mansoni]|eukprot:XP_018651904.1 carbonic anhydrase-related [Schistosoma mansoni]